MCLFSLAVRIFFGNGGDLVTHRDMCRGLEKDWTESRASGIGRRTLKVSNGDGNYDKLINSYDYCYFFFILMNKE